jgi:hypothetical protein
VASRESAWQNLRGRRAQLTIYCYCTAKKSQTCFVKILFIMSVGETACLRFFTGFLRLYGSEFPLLQFSTEHGQMLGSR